MAEQATTKGKYPATRKRADRTKQSYRAKTPEALERQRAALRLGREKLRSIPKPLRSKVEGPIEAVEVKREIRPPDDYPDDPIGFIEDHFYVIEGRRRMVLLDWQKEILREWFLAELQPNLCVLGQPKKTGKSTFMAAIVLWVLCNKALAEVYLLASVVQQAQLVCFDKLVKSVRMNPILRKVCKIMSSKGRIENKKTESFIQILPPNVSVAGVNPSLVIAEELWSWTTLEHKRSWDELTNVPTRPDNLNIVTSYAGYTEDEDSILWGLYKKGIDQAEGREEKDARFWFRWYGEELYGQVPWVKPTYLPEQKKRLRESTYARLHCNVWSSGEESFVDPQVVEACTNPDYKRGLPFEGRLVAGVDIGLKHDSSAIALVGALDAKTLAIIDHVVYVPFEGVTLDLERTVEAKLLAYFKIYDLVVVYYDPFQFARSARTLEKRGLCMHEYPQTVGNTVAMSETLAGVLSNQTLLLYEDMELRTHLLNARARQSQRGWRLVKKTQAGKIDLAVALAMAAQAATDKFLLAEDSYFQPDDFVQRD